MGGKVSENVKFKLKFLLIFIFYLGVSLFHCVSSDSRVCVYQNNCEKCLTADQQCAWCSDKSFGVTKPRCFTRDQLIASNCSKNEIVENSAETIILENKNTSDFKPDVLEIVQIQPQKIKMKLFKSHTEQIKMKYRPARDNPLDLYYLMDLTWSMKDDKQTLVNIGEGLTQALGNLTKNYRVGYGSFADKPAMPMIMPGSDDNPCRFERERCEPTYGFRHHLALTKNIREFIREVNTSDVTGNLDNLEGGLDALMQVIVCDEQIGWSEQARKIVVLATDGLMHLAGDGLLAGIVRKNDKTCHLDQSGLYIGSLDYDYPSLEEIYRELLRRKISVIFAVTENFQTYYVQMSDLMKEISSVEVLSMDSSNIVQLVEKGYTDFIRKAQFTDNSPSYMSVSFETTCGGYYPKLVQTNSCDNIQLGDEIDFHINITLDSVPTDGTKQFTLRIEESRISEVLEIDVEIQQECPCLSSNDPTEGEIQDGIELCNAHGTFRCGMCMCDEGWIGRSCSCNMHNHSSVRALESQCRVNNTSGLPGAICSDRGECECGQCYCNRGYTGEQCECLECEACDFERAQCVCGECVCNDGWTGDRCDCPISSDTCLSPSTGELCSGRGECKCGRCDCSESYFGPFCETSSSTGNLLCSYYEPCVKCLVEEKLKVHKCDNFTDLCSGKDKISFSYMFSDDASSWDIKCLMRLPNEEGEKCDHIFTYNVKSSTETNLHINIDPCKRVNMAYVGIGLFLLTLILGLLAIIIVKVLFTVKDRREFAKFEEEQKKKTQFNMESPIYKSPITNYQVPRARDDDEGYF